MVVSIAMMSHSTHAPCMATGAPEGGVRHQRALERAAIFRQPHQPLPPSPPRHHQVRLEFKTTAFLYKKSRLRLQLVGAAALTLPSK